MKDQTPMTQTPEQINRAQGFGRPASKAAATRNLVPTKQAAPVPSTQKAPPPAPANKPPAPATIAADDRSELDKYLDQADSTELAGPPVKFTKSGEYTRTDTDEILDDQTMWVAHFDQMMAGYRRFHGQGQPPTVVMRLAFDPDFEMPDRATLGDTAENEWEVVDGKPQDPWQLTNYLPLEHAETHELLCFVTSSRGGIKAVGRLLKHCKRVSKTDADFLPLIQLKTGGYNHPNKQFGWVNTPLFSICGRVSRGDAARPEPSGGAPFNDEVPFE
jgi:hypothetical protein